MKRIIGIICTALAFGAAPAIAHEATAKKPAAKPAVTKPAAVAASAAIGEGSGIAVAGYTDAAGKALPGGDTRINVASDGGQVTLRLENLYAYGEAGIKRGENGKRQAWYGSDPGYFHGGMVYALKLGLDWRGGKTAKAVDLEADKGLIVLGRSPVGSDQVTFTWPVKKPVAPAKLECQPLNYLLVKADGKRAWLGHPGWAESNTRAGVGPYMVLANNDSRFPATVVCVDQAGQIVPLSPAMRADLARIVQPPAGADTPETVADGK